MPATTCSITWEGFVPVVVAHREGRVVNRYRCRGYTAARKVLDHLEQALDMRLLPAGLLA